MKNQSDEWKSIGMVPGWPCSPVDSAAGSVAVARARLHSTYLLIKRELTRHLDSQFQILEIHARRWKYSNRFVSGSNRSVSLDKVNVSRFAITEAAVRRNASANTASHFFAQRGENGR
jgi:hypothetical protein